MEHGKSSVSIIFALAARNLKEHKSKTLIIMLFIIFGTAIVILGNSFLQSINRGLEKDFRAHYTGDIAISIVPPEGWNIDIFGVDSASFNGSIPQVPALPDLDTVQAIINAENRLVANTKLITANVLVVKGLEVDYEALLENDDLGIMDLPISILFAGEQDSYYSVFPGLHIIEGTLPKETNDILIDTRVKRNFEKTFADSLHVGDKVLVAGANTNGVVREATICGLCSPPDENSAMFQIIYTHPSFARAFADLTYAASFAQDLPESVDMSLSQLSEDDLFGDFGDDDESDIITEVTDILTSSEIDFNSILGDTTLRDQLNQTDDGSWHFILAKTKPMVKPEVVIKSLNEAFKEQSLNVRAINWKDAAHSYTATIEGLGIIFNVLIIILAIVVFIIIMNTMTISVIERTGEIGTMRALGSTKYFVCMLFFAEAVSVTAISAIIGTILAFIVMGIFNSLSITISNDIAKLILGGGLLHFSPTVGIVLTTIVIALLGSVLSNIYPVLSALKITPLKALSKGGQ